MKVRVLGALFALLVMLAALLPNAPASHPADADPPIVTIATPSPGVWQRGPFEAWVEVTDPPHVDYIAWVRVEIGDLVLQSPQPPYRFAIDPAQLDDGAHIIVASAADARGNTASVNQTLFLDQTPPTVNLVSHKDGDLVIATTTFEADAADHTSGMMRVAFYVGERFLGADTTAPYSLDWNGLLSPGIHHVKAVAIDVAGNTAEDGADVVVV